MFRKIGKYVFLHLTLLLYMVASVFSKLAGSHDSLSWGFLIFYGIAMFLLMVYAVLWQQVLKKMPLSVAFANKAVTVIWGIVLGIFLFNEIIRPTMYLGVVLIIVGIVLVSSEQEEHNQ